MLLWLILEDYNVVFDDIVDDVEIEAYFDDVIEVCFNVLFQNKFWTPALSYGLKFWLKHSMQGLVVPSTIFVFVLAVESLSKLFSFMREVIAAVDGFR